jgi:hypothetical protein
MGHRLSKPLYASDAVFSIMSECWSPDRPTFNSMSHSFEVMESDVDGAHKAETVALVTIPNNTRSQGYTFFKVASAPRTMDIVAHRASSVGESSANEVSSTPIAFCLVK